MFDQILLETSIKHYVPRLVVEKFLLARNIFSANNFVMLDYDLQWILLSTHCCYFAQF